VTPEYLHRHVLPATFALLPAAMRSQKAEAYLLAIALQESKCEHRRQIPRRPGGPSYARGLWQFEKGGAVTGVLTHRASRPIITGVIETLLYEPDVEQCYHAIEDNDVLACAFARCLLWTDPAPLPGFLDIEQGWDIYMRTWRPGDPHPETWFDVFRQGWAVATGVAP
jgi:hypothetical protein